MLKKTNQIYRLLQNFSAREMILDENQNLLPLFYGKLVYIFSFLSFSEFMH
jgi:hypothetical protein